MTVSDDIVRLVARRPGLTESQIARELFGKNAPQRRVNASCRRLVRQGLLRRRGHGGLKEPFTYHAPTASG